MGVEHFEYSEPGPYDMDASAGSYRMRIGTRNDGKEPVSNLRKLLIFKGTAIHSTSIDSIDNLLQSKLDDC